MGAGRPARGVDGLSVSPQHGPLKATRAHPHPPGHVGQRGEPSLGPRIDDRLRGVVPQTAHRSQAHPHGQVAVHLHQRCHVGTRLVGSLERSVQPLHQREHLGARHAWSQHHLTVTPSVGRERLRAVEAHGLGGQQPRIERGRLVDLEPARRVDQVRERERVGLREAEVGEGLELVKDLMRHVGRDAALVSAHHEACAQRLHPLRAALGAHGAA